MKAFSFKKLVVSCLLLGTLAACQTLTPETSMPVGVAVPPPTAFRDLCARAPEECVLPLTRETQEILAASHYMVKDLVIPTEEEGDYWQTLSERSTGDCEDFALTLRKYLRESMPEYGGAFLLATAYTEMGQYHAVLTIETEKGTLVCDIRFPQCAPWESFSYEWHLREVAGQRHWEDIGNHKILAELRSASVKKKR